MSMLQKLIGKYQKRIDTGSLIKLAENPSSAERAWNQKPKRGQKRLKSRITLFGGIPFDSSYKHVVDWKNQVDLNNYLEKFVHQDIVDSSFQPLDRPIRFPNTGEAGFNQLENYNYVRIIDYEDSPDGGAQNVAVYYAFITDIKYVNDGMTLLKYSLDMYNTFKDWVQYNDAFIKRGFVRDWAPGKYPKFTNDPNDLTHNFMAVKNNGEDIGGDGATRLLTSEQIYWMNYDQPFATKNHEKHKKKKTKALKEKKSRTKVPTKAKSELHCDGPAEYYFDDYISDDEVKFLVFTISPKKPQSEQGSYVGTYSQYEYCVLPFIYSDGQCCDVAVDGQILATYNQETVGKLFKELSQDPDLVGTSSLVQQLQIFSYIGIPYNLMFNGEKDSDGNLHTLVNFQSVWDKKGNSQHHMVNMGKPFPISMSKLPNANLVKIGVVHPYNFTFQKGVGLPVHKNSSAQTDLYDTFAERYGKNFPAKMMFSPYCKVSFVNGRGGQVDLDLSRFNWDTDGLMKNYFRVKRWGGVTMNGHEGFTIDDYSRSTKTKMKGYTELLNSQIIDDASRDVPFVVDYMTEFLNANKNQLQTNRGNYLMNKNLAMQGNAVNLQNTQNLLNAQSQSQLYANNRNNMMGTLNGAVGGLSAGLGVGGPIGAGAGAIAGGLLGFGTTAFNNQTQYNAAQMNRNAQGQNAERNEAYQNKAAGVNYTEEMRSQNAMLKDTANHNGDIADEGSNFLFDIQNTQFTYRWQIWTSQDSVMRNVEWYFTMFGYSIEQRWDIKPFLSVCSEFNYVQAIDVNITGDVNDATRSFFDSMFTQGVTVWNPKAIKDFEIKNQGNNHWNY